MLRREISLFFCFSSYIGHFCRSFTLESGNTATSSDLKVRCRFWRGCHCRDNIVMHAPMAKDILRTVSRSLWPWSVPSWSTFSAPIFRLSISTHYDVGFYASRFSCDWRFPTKTSGQPTLIFVSSPNLFFSLDRGVTSPISDERSGTCFLAIHLARSTV